MYYMQSGLEKHTHMEWMSSLMHSFELYTLNRLYIIDLGRDEECVHFFAATVRPGLEENKDVAF